MLDNILFSLNVVLPSFIMIFIGWLAREKGVIEKGMMDKVGRLTFTYCLSSRIFLDIQGADFRQMKDLALSGYCLAATVLTYIVIWILARIFLRDKSLTGEFVQACYRSSAAILGVAFIQNIYGTSGMAPLMMLGSVPLFNIFAVLILTIENPSHKGKLHPGTIRYGILTNPILDGILIGTIYNLLPIGLPTMAQKTFSTLGSLTTPLTLLSIGASFEDAKAIKFGFRGQELIALLIMLGSPTTPASYVMSKNMGHDGTLSASCVAATTLFSAITMTLWIYVLSAGGFLA